MEFLDATQQRLNLGTLQVCGFENAYDMLLQVIRLQRINY